jgi:phosphinothricin acetyltransferase
MIRPVNAETDSAQILKIYQPYILKTSVSFETDVPSLEEFRLRIKNYSRRSPWLVKVINDQVVGYAYATSHRSRQAYQWTQEVTVYVHPDYQRQGIASDLYKNLIDSLKDLGFQKILGIITLPNEKSVKFHECFGFELIGTMKRIGFKHGQWHDTIWYGLNINSDQIPPELTNGSE